MFHIGNQVCVTIMTSHLSTYGKKGIYIYTIFNINIMEGSEVQRFVLSMVLTFQTSFVYIGAYCIP